MKYVSHNHTMVCDVSSEAASAKVYILIENILAVVRALTLCHGRFTACIGAVSIGSRYVVLRLCMMTWVLKKYIYIYTEKP